MVKSASFSIYFTHSTSFHIFRSSTEGIKGSLIISRRESQKDEFKVAKVVTWCCTEVPEIQDGIPRLMARSCRAEEPRATGQQSCHLS